MSTTATIQTVKDAADLPCTKPATVRTLGNTTELKAAA